MSAPAGILPLARQLAEFVGKGPNHPREGTLEVPMIETRVVSLDPTRWGFKSHAEMDAAFSEETP